jgi:hypothetical protein
MLLPMFDLCCVHVVSFHRHVVDVYVTSMFLVSFSEVMYVTTNDGLTGSIRQCCNNHTYFD